MEGGNKERLHTGYLYWLFVRGVRFLKKAARLAAGCLHDHDARVILQHVLSTGQNHR